MKLTEDPIPILLRKIAVPTSVGFFFHTMFNVVDTYYAGLHSTDALAALSLSFPIFFSILAFGIGLSQGATALMSNALGAEDEKEGVSYFRQSLTQGLTASTILTFFGYLSLPTLFKFLGAEDQYLQLSLDYMNVVVLGSFLFIVQNVLNSALTAKGLTKPFRNFLIGSFFVNVVLDPLLMFGYGPIPELGIAGLAWATVLIQAMGAIYMTWEVRKEGYFTGVSVRDFAPKWVYQKKIFAQAFPASLNMLSIALGGFIITYFVAKFGKAGVAAYGASLRIEQLFLLPTVGLNSAVLTLVGQNNGAGLTMRVKDSWYTAIKWGVGMMVVGGGALYLFAENLLAIFSEDASVLEIGSTYLKLASFTLGAYVIMFTTNSLLQGLKRPKFVVYIGAARQILAPALVFPILGAYWYLDGIWYGVVGIVWFSAVITFWWGLRSSEQSAGV